MYDYHFLLAYKVSAKRFVHSLMVASLYIANCFSLAAFKILSLSFIFSNLILMCLSVSLLDYFYLEPSGFGALVELFPMSHRLAGCQLPVRRTGEGLDPVMDRRWKNCHRKTASGFSLDRGADANL